MPSIATYFLLALFLELVHSTNQPRTLDRDLYVLQLRSNLGPSDLAQHIGLRYDGPLGSLEQHHIFSSDVTEVDVVEQLIAQKPEMAEYFEFAQKQALQSQLYKRRPSPDSQLGARPGTSDGNSVNDVDQFSILAAQSQMMKELEILDPTFTKQWHLFNTAEVGHDLNLTDLWMAGVNGNNVTVAIVDDGLDMTSEDLRDNYMAAASYDFNDKVPDPVPRLPNDDHGTRCAGEIAAGKNTVCGLGVAWGSKVSGIRTLSGTLTEAEEALALNYAFQVNDIYSCSWGPKDDGKTVHGPGPLVQRALVNGVNRGRQGRGSVYVFAAGNGARKGDNCNFDGYANSIFTITIGAIDRFDVAAAYSESCSALLAVTYSNGEGDGIQTTDRGINTCTSAHGGTSASAPLAAGVYALVLQVRPDLSWRDVQHLTVHNSIPLERGGDWQETGSGRKFSHQFGYGKINAGKIVEAAISHPILRPQVSLKSPELLIDKKIPEGNAGVSTTHTFTQDTLSIANVSRVEHVTITVDISHSKRGDLSIKLVSPAGIASYLAVNRQNDDSTDGFQRWNFMSVAHWGESGQGTWTLTVLDDQINGYTGVFNLWQMTLWGESTRPALPNSPTDNKPQELSDLSSPSIAQLSASQPPIATSEVAQISHNALSDAWIYAICFLLVLVFTIFFVTVIIFVTHSRRRKAGSTSIGHLRQMPRRPDDTSHPQKAQLLEKEDEAATSEKASLLGFQGH